MQKNDGIFKVCLPNCSCLCDVIMAARLTVALKRTVLVLLILVVMVQLCTWQGAAPSNRVEEQSVDCSQFDNRIQPGVSNNSIDLTNKGKKVPASNNGKVIIYAKYRTGSTFTSEFFFRHRDIAYMFEPLRLKDSRDIVKDGQQILWDMLSCRFQTDEVKRVLGWWMDRVVFCQITDQTPGCLHGHNVAISRALEHCNSVNNRVVKVIRIENIWELEEHMREGVKVVHVVRDPRGLTHSRMKLHKAHTHFGQVDEASREYCEGAVEDIRYIQRQVAIDEAAVKQRYHVIRYEDLAWEPEQQMEELYNFLQITPDDSLKTWVRQTTNASESGATNNKGYVYGTNRANPAYTSIAWHKTMKYSDVETVQKNCANFMDVFGYTSLFSEEELRQSDKSLFTKMDTNLIFHGHS